MAIELLHSQVQHLNDETAARKRGKPGPQTLSTKREVHHDLEAFIWVLVYAMMLHNYNSLTRETDRKDYKQTLDEYFGHGSARTTVSKRHAILNLALSYIGQDKASSWFADQHERKFFMRCMTLIANHNKGEEEEDCGTFEGGINRGNPLWDSDDDDDGDYSYDEDVHDVSGTYVQGKTTKAIQNPVAGLRKRQPVITYESVVAILKKSLDELN